MNTRQVIWLLLACMATMFGSSYTIASTLPLPDHVIALSSPRGTLYFDRSYLPNYFWRLDSQFLTQQNITYCSIASSVMVLNALNVPAPNDPNFVPDRIFTQDNFFTPAVEKVLPLSLVRKKGSTLDQLGRALATFPVSVRVVHANEMNANQFRVLAENIIHSQSGYIIVNFSRPSLAEEGEGHMSPLAAYDKESDRFLMLDVARFRYPSAWIKTEDLWKAMDTIDKDSNKYRGFIIIQAIAN